jgi:1,4-dihydroxy-2-naphthoate polyprenyltransferase
MTSDTTVQSRSGFSVWIQAVRAFAFPASVVPVLVGGMLAMRSGAPVRWELFPIAIICALLYHAATNLISDYFDYQKGVDKDYTFGSSRVVVDGLLTAKQIYAGGWLLFGIGAALGLILVAVRGTSMLLFGVVGLLGGYLYCGRPVGFKYFALGDIGVFTLMGPLMVLGSFYALTGILDLKAVWVSVPIGMLTVAILHANNTRDIAHDTAAHIKTTASVIGHSAAKVEYFFLVIGAFVAIIVMVATKVLPIWSLVVLISLPPALKNLKTMLASHPGAVEDIATLDVLTAQHNLMFGLLLAISIAVGALVH